MEDGTMTDSSSQRPQADDPLGAVSPISDGDPAATAEADGTLKLVGLPSGTAVTGGAVLGALRAWKRRRRSRKR